MVYAGIDGGGSTLRVAIIDDSLVSLAEEQRSTANPSVIGREAAAALIQDALRAAAARVSLPIEGVGIGVAGASAAHSADWLARAAWPWQFAPVVRACRPVAGAICWAAKAAGPGWRWRHYAPAHAGMTAAQPKRTHSRSAC